MLLPGLKGGASGSTWLFVESSKVSVVRDAAVNTTIRPFVRGLKTGVGRLMVMMLLETLPVWKACVRDEDCCHGSLCVQKRARGRGLDITAVDLAADTALREY